MIYNRMNGINTIVWSHGINLQKRKQRIRKLPYYFRQYLANALIIYSKDQKQYIKASHKKLFIANNTLNFHDFPKIIETKEEIKAQKGLSNKKIIISVGRFNTNNRKVSHLTKLAELLDSSYHILIIGPGLSGNQIKKIDTLSNIEYCGPIYDVYEVCKLFKGSDLFIMPGAIGLAILKPFIIELQ